MITLTSQQKADCIETAKALVAFPSVCGPAEGAMPFGKDIQSCLEYALDYCQSLGCTTYLDPAGYYGYADYGQGEELIGIVGHLDVVPEGDHALWHTEPFTGTVIDDKLYGRGSGDDKGPTAASLHGLKAVIDSGVTFKKRVRYIFSTDEESMFRCLKAYRQQEEIPTATLVPDGRFPFTYGEKGLVNIKLHGPGTTDFSLNGGEAFNIVPSKAHYQGPQLTDLLTQLTADKQDVTQTGSDTLTVTGTAVHASVNHLGNNAVSQLAVALNHYAQHPLLQFISQEIGLDPHGTALLGELEDDISGKVAFNLGKLEINENSSQLWLDIRYPLIADYADIRQKIEVASQAYGLGFEEYDQWDGALVPLETPFLQTVLRTYQDLTKDFTPPGITTGATLARTLPNAIAFGTKSSQSTNSTAHQANEYVELSDLYNGMDIYANVLATLVTSDTSLIA